MEITREQRQLAEEGASEVQLFLYAEPESGEKLWSIATMFNLAERKAYQIFTRTVGDVILGFYKPTDIPALLKYNLPGLDDEKIARITKELYVFLAPIIPDEQKIVPHPQTQILETERELSQLQTIRTMSQDMATVQPGAEVVYQSTQADILRQAPIAPAPPTDIPRWETDTKQ